MIKGIEQAKDRSHALVDRGHELVVDGTTAAERKVEQAANAVIDGTHATAAKVRERAQSATRSAHGGVDGAAEAIDRGVGSAQDGLLALRSYVVTNPGRALLFSAAAGFGIGWLMCRRNA